MNVVRTWNEDTNNGWGFGGYNATFKEYDNGLITRIGHYSHRHTGTSSANQVFVRIAEDFSIPVDEMPTLKGVSVICVYRHGDSYIAYPKDKGETVEKWGWIYKKIKTIIL